tara:strand:+ start:1293 stop:1466 length:174 start_codon:yes stop_codon:yes gene_type:complete
MAKTITIELSDDEFTNLKKVWSSEDIIKSKLIGVLKAAMRGYDKSSTTVTYTSFEPK